MYGRKLKGINNDLSVFCSECGCMSTRATLSDHLVSVHGYIREGAQVFKRRYCAVCGKVAFYRFGAKSFCSEHKDRANATAVKRALVVDTYRSDRERESKQEDRLLKAKTHLHNVKK